LGVFFLFSIILVANLFPGLFVLAFASLLFVFLDPCSLRSIATLRFVQYCLQLGVDLGDEQDEVNSDEKLERRPEKHPPLERQHWFGLLHRRTSDPPRDELRRVEGDEKTGGGKGADPMADTLARTTICRVARVEHLDRP